MRGIYLLDSDLRFRGVIPPEDQSFVDLAGRFDGTPIGEAWRPFDLEYDPDSMHLPLGDFPSIFLSHVPVFSVRAAEALEPVLRTNGEMFRLRCDNDEYVAFNVTSVVGALSNTADIHYFPSGRIMAVTRYVLERERLTSKGIFKLLEVPLLDVFVDDEFLEIVQRSQLRGFTFKPVDVN